MLKLAALCGLFLFLYLNVNAQNNKWYKATDTLKAPPKENLPGNNYSRWINMCLLEPILIRTSSSDTIVGYKLVYRYEGRKIDTRNSVNVFFDKDLARIPNVTFYKFWDWVF